MGQVSKRPLTISAQYGLIDQSEFFDRQIASKDMSSYYLLKNGEFAYNKSYSNDYPWGAVKRLDKYECGALSTLYICFNLDNSIVNSDFISHYFETNKWHKGVSDIAGEGARNHGLLNMSVEDYFLTKHYLPSLIEQEKISYFLNLITARIETQSKIIEDLNVEKKVISDKIFSQKPIRKELLCSFYNKGKAGGTPKSTNKKYYDGDIPFLSISDMTEQGKYLYRTQRTLTQEGLENSTAWIVPENSLILSMYASVGQVAINKIPLATSQAMFSMTLKDKNTVDFLYYYLSYFRENKLHKYLETGTQSNINADFVKSIEIPYYGDSKNKQIVSLLSLMDERIQKEKDILALYKKQKAYLLSNMFI